MKKQVFWVLAGLTSFTVSLAVLAPLSFFTQQVTQARPELSFAGVSGSLWKGKIAKVNTPQAQVTDLTWTFAPAKLLSGMLAVELEGNVQAVHLKGQCGFAWNTHLACSPLNLELAAAALGQVNPALQNLPVALGGTFRAIIDDIHWDRETMPIMNGSLIWADGSVQTPIAVSLGGQYRARVREGSGKQAVNIALQSDQARIVLDGKVDIEKDGLYTAEIFLKPSAEADPSIAQGLSLLGSVQTDGSVQLKSSGQISLNLDAAPAAVAAASPAPAATPQPAAPAVQPVPAAEED